MLNMMWKKENNAEYKKSKKSDVENGNCYT